MNDACSRTCLSRQLLANFAQPFGVCCAMVAGSSQNRPSHQLSIAARAAYSRRMWPGVGWGGGRVSIL